MNVQLDTRPRPRRGAWIQTYSGGEFWPLDPHPDDIRIVDIANALSKICRFGGHCIRFMSVAEHCVYAAEAAPEHLKLTALLHDASEAYLLDIPRPIKQTLPGYVEAEERLMRAIASKYDIHWPLPPEVKRIDHALLSDERDQNMATTHHTMGEWGNTEPALGVRFGFWDQYHAEYEFLTAFKKYGGRE